MSSTSISSSLSSSVSLHAPPPDRRVYKKLDCLRVSANIFMLASVVALLATAVLIGLTSADYLPSTTPLFGVGAFIVLLIPTITLDCIMRSTARKNKIDLVDYMRVRQPPPPPPPTKKPKKPKSTEAKV